MAKGTGVLREKNKRLVLSYIRKLKSTSRKELVSKIGVSKNTISLIIEELLLKGLVIEVGKKEPGEKGRPKQVLELNRNGLKSIGISVGKSYIKYTVLNYYGEIIEEKKIDFTTTVFEKTNKKISQVIQGLLESYDCILGIGIAIPGIVNADEKIVYKSVQLNWEKESFENLNEFNVPVHIQNSVNMTAISAIEMEGYKIEESFFYIHIGNGVGGAYIGENSKTEGASWTAGEIGHVSVDPHGPYCECGQRGCLEQLISLTTFKNYLKLENEQNLFEQMFSSKLVSLTNSTETVLRQYGEYLGKAIIPIIHLLNPHRIIISAPYDIFEDFCNSCIGYVKNNALTIPYNKTNIVFSKEKSSKSRGAGLTVIHKYERSY